jgi:murein DD-endopeptidase MepM/ murein hydrolase activator NlpD
MRQQPKKSFKDSTVYQYFDRLYRELKSFIQQCLSAKKVLIISDKGISSIPFSTRTQSLALVAAVFFMLWVSYSTGKYFAYEGIISEKEREIWSTNVTNENLQYKVSDLHENLTQLNHYFENIQNFDQLAGKTSTSTGDAVVEKDVASTIEEVDEKVPYGKVQQLLFNIRDKVMERISSLENVIEVTGVKIQNIAYNNDKLKNSLARYEERKQKGAPQGGPYDPADVETLNSDRESLGVGVQYLVELEKLVHSMPLSPPIDRFWISSHFGKRYDPFRKRLAMHHGTDLVGSFKAKIVSTAPGVVTYARSYGAYGRFVEVEHAAGLTTRYGHLHKILVKRGQRVERGQVIGLQGNTGRSTGDHLHYEVRYDNKPIDPEKFLKAGKYVF